MKKKYLMYAGIVSATLLVVMFASILLTGSFTIFPSASIDPVPDHAAGDLVVITGTTNLAAGTRLELDVTAVPSAPGTNPVAGSTDAFIVRGGGMSNTWSGALDTSGISPGEYLVNAYRMNETYARGALLATSRLRLTNTTSDPAKSMRVTGKHQISFINIDRPGTIYRGEKILVTGTTNLPEGTDLLYRLIQQSGKSVFTVDPKTGKRDMKEGLTRSGLITVLAGDGGAGQWSFALDSTEFYPDQYEVLVSPAPTSAGDTGTGDPFATATLVVLEAASDRLTPQVPDKSPCRSITIDAFPERSINRAYTITGTTSLSPGTELLFTVFPVEFNASVSTGTNGPSGSIYGATGTLEVTGGTGGTAPWSADLDISKFPQGEYLVNVSNDRMDPRTHSTIYGDTYCSRILVIPG